MVDAFGPCPGRTGMPGGAATGAGWRVPGLLDTPDPLTAGGIGNPLVPLIPPAPLVPLGTGVVGGESEGA